jgi:hypothetical protein
MAKFRYALGKGQSRNNKRNNNQNLLIYKMFFDNIDSLHISVNGY